MIYYSIIDCRLHLISYQLCTCSGPVSHYALLIAEDDGSPDADFPCLEPKEVVGKFGFTTLALVGVASPKRETSDDNIKTPPTSPTDKEPTAAAAAANNNQVQVNSVLESTDFHSFSGFLLHNVRPKTEVSIGKLFAIGLESKCEINGILLVGISWEQVEIKANVNHRTAVSVATFFWPRRPTIKPVLLAMEQLVDCLPIDSVPPSVAIIYYHVEKRKWRRLRIECDAKTIQQVVAKLRFILEIRGGHYRQEYLHHTTENHSYNHKAVGRKRIAKR